MGSDKLALCATGRMMAGGECWLYGEQPEPLAVSLSKCRFGPLAVLAEVYARTRGLPELQQYTSKEHLLAELRRRTDIDLTDGYRRLCRLIHELRQALGRAAVRLFGGTVKDWGERLVQYRPYFGYRLTVPITLTLLEETC